MPDRGAGAGPGPDPTQEPPADGDADALQPEDRVTAPDAPSPQQPAGAPDDAPESTQPASTQKEDDETTLSTMPDAAQKELLGDAPLSDDDAPVDALAEEPALSDDATQTAQAAPPDTIDPPATREIVEGTAANEEIDVTALDFVTGGGGADVFTLEAGVGIGEQAEIADFDPENDQLIVLWDDSEGEVAPELSLGTVEGAPDLAQVLLDGVVVAHVSGAGALAAEDIELVPASTM